MIMICNLEYYHINIPHIHKHHIQKTPYYSICKSYPLRKIKLCTLNLYALSYILNFA